LEAGVEFSRFWEAYARKLKKHEAQRGEAATKGDQMRVTGCRMRDAVLRPRGARWADAAASPEISSSEQKISEVPGVNRYG
jgi:hypothetical protein